MDFKVGGEYRARNGGKAVMLSEDSGRDGMPFRVFHDKTNATLWHYDNGVCNIVDRDEGESEHDLVAIWEGPVDEDQGPRHELVCTIIIRDVAPGCDREALRGGLINLLAEVQNHEVKFDKDLRHPGYGAGSPEAFGVTNIYINIGQED